VEVQFGEIEDRCHVSLWIFGDVGKYQPRAHNRQLHSVAAGQVAQLLILQPLFEL
jgi:hypothetical protein